MGNQESNNKAIGDFLNLFSGKNLFDITPDKKRVKK